MLGILVLGILRMEAGMARRIAFVTIRQSPRPDVVPEILAETRTPIEVTERGVLDDMTLAEVRAIAPGPGEERLVSRMRDGRR